MKGCKRAVTTAVGLALGMGSFAQADSLADQMTQAKVEADLGHSATAITIFTTIAADPAAPRSLQAEALVRLGAARAAAGDAQGRVAAFERVVKEHGDDEEAIRLLILAVGSAVPGPDRWEQAWRKVQLGIDVTHRERPTPWIRWPEAPWNFRRTLTDDKAKVVRFVVDGPMGYTGAPISLDFKDGDLQDIFRLFADISGLNVVVNPGVKGFVTFKLMNTPWDDVLDRLLSANGLWYQLNENVLHIAPVDQLLAQPTRRFTGKAIDLDYKERELRDAFRSIASHGGNLKVEFGPSVAGHLSLKLNAVHWDQAFDLVARVNGLRWKRSGGTILVGRPEEVVVTAR